MFTDGFDVDVENEDDEDAPIGTIGTAVKVWGCDGGVIWGLETKIGVAASDIDEVEGSVSDSGVLSFVTLSSSLWSSESLASVDSVCFDLSAKAAAAAALFFSSYCSSSCFCFSFSISLAFSDASNCFRTCFSRFPVRN